ncbi:MAG: hypothetical protein NTW62_01055 [Candidatus Nomurabacteria bacterium]|nr:hypothetical protein [Candidatus Nomurabacteria bacterium]
MILYQGGGNWNWGGPAYTGTSFVNNIYSTAITDTPTVPTTYYVSCNSAVGGPLLISSILVTPTSVATGDVLVLKVTESNTTNTISNPATTTTPVPVDRSISVAQSNGVSISWAGIPSTLYYPKCFAGSSNGGSWSWAGWNSGGATLPSNFSPIIMDHPTVPTKYYVSCSDIVSGTTYSSEIIVTPVAGAPVSPALSLQIVNGTSAPVFSNSNNTTPTPYPTPMTIPLGSSIDISWAGDTLLHLLTTFTVLQLLIHQLFLLLIMFLVTVLLGGHYCNQLLS